MATVRPFHLSIVEAVDALRIDRSGDLEVLDALARLTANTAIPREHRIAVGAAFARQEKVVMARHRFRRAHAVLQNIKRTISSVSEQDDSD